MVVGITAEICGQYRETHEGAKPLRSVNTDGPMEYLPLYKRFSNSKFQCDYFDWILDTLDVSYKFLNQSNTTKLFKILSGILPSFYSFSVAVSRNPAEVMEEVLRFTSKEKASVSTGVTNTEGINISPNSSINTNLVENNDLKQRAEISEDEIGLDAGSHLIDYYEAAILFHAVPNLNHICNSLLTTLESFESGGLHLLNIFVDSELQMDYKLFQCFILNFFVWGSHPLVDYFEGKEDSDYCTSAARATVTCFLI